MDFEKRTGSMIFVPAGTPEPAGTQYEIAEPEELTPLDEAARKIGAHEIRDMGRQWPTFAVGEPTMIKGVLFLLVDCVNGGLVYKPYKGPQLPDAEKKRVVADMIPKR